MKGIALLTLALILAACAATSASATDRLDLAVMKIKDRHVTLGWSGPYLAYGEVQVATSSQTDSDGNFFSGNVVASDLFDAYDDNWTFPDPFRPRTYWARVEGWDTECQSHDDGNGTLTWTGCEIFSNIVKFTVKPICKKKLLHHGHFTYRKGRRIWHKPVYKTVCS